MKYNKTTKKQKFREECKKRILENLKEFIDIKGKTVGSIRQISEISGISKKALYLALERGQLKEISNPHFGKLVNIEDVIQYLSKNLGRPKKLE